ncbi:MAG: hypothetical protein EZS28_049822 [Streblomastix strix]|uniref:Protein kinase domain-containing protein n=1 Tax=Streblomastix strix TaxID=222440 RepID=A0A5J4TAD4_9EUKA|nr:MAG: hypothetical protein EZS28_049822 [Streblomastix strix]
MAQSVVGTFYTMAPELWKNLKYSEKADLFSLGVILYELVTLNRPFQGRNAFSIGRQICDDDPEPIDNKSHFSDQAKNLIFQLLDKNPDNRPSTNDILQIDQVKLKIVLHQKVQDEITKHDDEIKLRQIELFRQKQKRIFEKEQREMEKAEKKKQNKIKQIEKKQEQDQQKKIDKQTKEDQKEDNEEEEDDEEEDDDDSSDDDDEYDQIQYTPFPFYFASEGRIDVRRFL